MKFGIFYELSVPRPWTRESERQVYLNALEQVRLADELGFDQVWAVEHHFLEEYSHCSAPELFLTACAMQTERIRVGHGIVICVPQFNHPVRIAERAAVLDILSGGRLEMGTGRSATWTELGGFRAHPDETKKSWDEFVRCLPKMWTEDYFGFEGTYFSMPPRAILPKPYQRPHPPLWVAVSSPGTEFDAADRGMGAVGVSFNSFAEQEKKVKEYRHRIQHCDPVGAFVNDQMNAVNMLFCHDDMEVGVRTGLQLSGTFNYLAAQFDMAREMWPTKAYPSSGLLASVRQQASSPGEAKGPPEGIAIGNPDHIRKELKKWEACGVDRICFMLNMGEVIPQQQVLDSLRLFAAEVMPAFADSRRRERGLMPFFGEMDVEAAIGAAPLLDVNDTEPWLLPKAQYVQVTYEAEHAGSMRLTPPSLHPAVPPYVTISALHCPESPLGPFTLAQVRLAVRAGIRPRALLLGAFCSSGDVADELTRGWGWAVREADVRFAARHDSVRASVAVDGRTVLEFEGAEYEPVGAGDVMLLDNLHLVRLVAADPDAPSSAIVQVDPIFQIISVDRGRPVLRTFDSDACGGRGYLRLTAPVTAVTCVADVELPRPRFAMDTRIPALQSSRKLGQATASPR